jgi:uncharacterized spore protein YtfJ
LHLKTGNTALKRLLKLKGVTGKPARNSAASPLLVIFQLENTVGFATSIGLFAGGELRSIGATGIMAVPFAALVTSAVTIFSSSLTVM